jgi:hypothetical protein
LALASDDIKSFVRARLGYPNVAVEIHESAWPEIEKEALRHFNTWSGSRTFGTVTLLQGQMAYTVNIPRGPIRVEFIRAEGTPIISDPLFGRDYPRTQFIDFASYDLSLHYYNVLRRLTGVEPEWDWDEVNKLLYINIGSTNFQSGVGNYLVAYEYLADMTLAQVPKRYEQWLLEMALAVAKQIVGGTRRKFGGIPGPQGVVQMDGQQLVDEGIKEMTDLVTKASKWHSVPPTRG